MGSPSTMAEGLCIPSNNLMSCRFTPPEKCDSQTLHQVLTRRTAIGKGCWIDGQPGAGPDAPIRLFCSSPGSPIDGQPSAGTIRPGMRSRIAGRRPPISIGAIF